MGHKIVNRHLTPLTRVNIERYSKLTCRQSQVSCSFSLQFVLIKANCDYNNIKVLVYELKGKGPLFKH